MVNGYFSLPHTLSSTTSSMPGTREGWRSRSSTPRSSPASAVPLTLFVSSMLGYVFSRFSFRANLLLLMMFTAGNLLPPQVIIVPLYRIYLLLPLPQSLSDFGHCTTRTSA